MNPNSVDLLHLLRRFPLTLLTVIFVLSACGRYGDHALNWDEDVLLDDGMQVRVKRHVVFTDWNSLAQDSYGAVETESTLQLAGEFASVPVWSAPLIPLLLYRGDEKQEWVIVATIGSCDGWRERGKPNPPYLEYRFEGSAWRQTALSPESIGKNTNIFFNYHAGIPADPMTIGLKQQDMADPTVGKRFVRILSSARPSCMD
jgi:hypothetical protein